MQSYSGADGTYSLTVTFKIGTDSFRCEVLGYRARCRASAVGPEPGASPYRREVHFGDPLFVTLTPRIRPGRRLSSQLRDDQHSRRVSRRGVGSVTCSA
jgi:hypothetical protein